MQIIYEELNYNNQDEIENAIVGFYTLKTIEGESRLGI